MNFETMLNSIKGSFSIEGMNMTSEVEQRIKDMNDGKKTIDECIAETISRYSARTVA